MLFFALGVLTFLFSYGSAKPAATRTTNAQRFARFVFSRNDNVYLNSLVNGLDSGLPPLRPASLYSPTRVRGEKNAASRLLFERVPQSSPSQPCSGERCPISNDLRALRRQLWRDMLHHQLRSLASDGSGAFYVTMDCLDQSGNTVTNTIGIQNCFNINTSGDLVCQHSR